MPRPATGDGQDRARGNLVAALAQRRDDRLDDLEAVVQVLTKLAAHQHRLEVSIGGRDHAHVYFDPLVAAKLGELRVLQHVEELGLERRPHLANLVEEDRAEVRLLELADAGRGGAGERALLVPEELALEQLRRQRGAVDFDERLRLSRGSLMDRARHQLLAAAALAGNEHGDVAVGHLLDDVRDLPHGGAVAPPDERLVLIVAQLAPQIAQLADQARALDRLLDRGIERNLTKPFRVAGLDDVIGGAEPHGLDDDRRLLAPREHDDLQLGTRRLERLERLQAVHAGHGHIEQHDVRRFALPDGRDDLVAARVGARFVAAQREERPQVPRKAGVVIDDGDGGAPFVGRVSGCRACRGTSHSRH
jgi:hypothetical protein